MNNLMNLVETGMNFAVKFVVRNRKAILTGVGIVATGSAVIAAAYEAPLARDAIEMEANIKAKRAEAQGRPAGEGKLTFVEKVKTGARYLWLPTALFAAGIGSFLIVNKISAKELMQAGANALTYKQAYKELADMHNDYVKASKEVMTEDQHNKIVREVAEKHVPEQKYDKAIDCAAGDGRGKVLILETLSGQYFRKEPTMVANAISAFYKKMYDGTLPNSESAAWHAGTPNEFLSQFLMIEPMHPEIGDEIYFTADRFDAHLDYYNPVCSPWGEPAIPLIYDYAPAPI